MWWGPELLQFHNEAYLPILADREEGALGAPARTLWADVFDDLEPYLDSALAGRGVGVEDMLLMMSRGGERRRSYFTFSYSPLYDDHGAVAGVLNVVTETTAAVEARRVQATLNDALSHALGEANDRIDQQREAAKVRAVVQRELSHRLKNVYAMVQAIVSQSVRNASSLDGVSQVIAQRVQAMAAAQDVLMQSSEDKAFIGDIVAAALAPHQETAERISIAGPEIKLSAQRGMGLALAVHELATNATKYGGLSTPEGKARASWRSDGGTFRFEWVELGGPAPTPPTRKGFGSRLLERVVPSYFEGGATLDYASEGLRYVLEGEAGGEDRPPLGGA